MVRSRHADNYTLDLLDAKGSLLRTLPLQDSPTELTGAASGLYLLRLTPPNLDAKDRRK
jgi:hypothetical protein